MCPFVFSHCRWDVFTNPVKYIFVQCCSLLVYWCTSVIWEHEWSLAVLVIYTGCLQNILYSKHVYTVYVNMWKNLQSDLWRIWAVGSGRGSDTISSHLPSRPGRPGVTVGQPGGETHTSSAGSQTTVLARLTAGFWHLSLNAITFQMDQFRVKLSRACLLVPGGPESSDWVTAEAGCSCWPTAGMPQIGCSFVMINQ